MPLPKSRHIASLALALSMLALAPARAHAWGPDGHKIVARIAYRHLNSTARQAVDDLLNGAPLESVANWADDFRQSHPETSRWHFVDMPRDADGYVPARDCRREQDDNGQDLGDCAIKAIRRFQPVLRNTHNTRAQRIKALKFLVHFVGDLHQPLHCGDPSDRGGNDILVTFLGDSMKLHRVWDSGIIREAGLSNEEFANELDATILADPETATPAERAAAEAVVRNMQQGTLEQWANDSHRLAVDHAYRRAPGGQLIQNQDVLGDDYYDNNWKAVDDQLLRGGLRLARILNTLLS